MRANAMQTIRTLIAHHARLAALLLALALCVRVLVPAGTMLNSEHGTITVSLCSNLAAAPKAITIDVGSHERGGDHAKDNPCAFTALAHAATAGADAPLLALALAFILVLGLAPARSLPLPQWAHLRPPLRGPPQAAPAA
jgi:hypothetical protein